MFEISSKYLHQETETLKRDKPMYSFFLVAFNFVLKETLAMKNVGLFDIIALTDTPVCDVFKLAIVI